ncbi:MAG: extracellular solute-binding protein [Alphaproteobacteria bacterium]
MIKSILCYKKKGDIEMKIKQLLLLLAGVVAVGVVGILLVGRPSSDNLRVYDWAGYDDPTFFQPYMEKHDQVPPDFSFFAEEEEMRAKMASGFKIDIAHPCSYNAVRLKDSDLIQPIDVSRLDNYGDLVKRYSELPGFIVDGEVYMIPFDIGQTAITYNADKVPASDVRSLNVFVNPKYAGKISLGDNFSDVIPLALLAVGVTDWTTIKSQDDPRYQRALTWLRRAHKNNKFYWTDGPNLAAAMKTGEVLVSWAWNETPITLQSEGLNVQMTRDNREGFTSYVCGYVWSKSSTADPKKVYDFFDAVIDEVTTKPLVGDFGYAHSNAVGMKNLPKEILDASVVNNMDRYLDKVSFQVAIPDDVAKFMNDDFNKIKAGN